MLGNYRSNFTIVNALQDINNYKMSKENWFTRLGLRRIIGYLTWIFAIILIVSSVRNVKKTLEIRKEIEKERGVVKNMEIANSKLQEEIIRAQSQDFIDKQIRNKLGLTKDGETVVILPDESIVKNLAPKIDIDEEDLPDPNWVKWRKLFW